MNKNHPLLELKTVANVLYSEANKTLTKVGLTLNQADVLRYVLMNGEKGEITQKNLQDVFKVKHSTMSGTIKRMEEKGFLQTYQSPTDKRNIVVKPTEKTKLLTQEIKSTNKLIGKCFGTLSIEELQTFISILHKIYSNI